MPTQSQFTILSKNACALDSSNDQTGRLVVNKYKQADSKGRYSYNISTINS